MTCYVNNSLFFFFFFVFIGFACSSSISYDALDPHGRSGRALLQAKKTCNVSFENLDYSILTSRCKGPQYPPKLCCSAFTEFACPFSEALNDRTNNCAETMFSYINLYGKYPPGLFANICKGDKEGLSCENVQSSTSASTSLQFGLLQSSSIVAAGLLGLYFHLF
ncbi:GPI-anchored protein LORELEI [Euphorbia peplus]|nr:GPI-anchored protein LORELEI [Euphorbia peplus]